MDSDAKFQQLAKRDTEITMLAARGRRRVVALMILVCVPAPFIVMKLNDDSSLASLIPIGLACFGGICYSWSKWTRRPEDAQSVAFVGLDRRRRGATYRAMRTGTGIDDPVVYTIVESISHHMHRVGVWPLVVTATAIAVPGVALLVAGGHGSGVVVAAGVAVLLGAMTVAAYRWVSIRVEQVLSHRPG